jgi:D-alanyl-D-alanine carboxypeptidase (penicillin-binding protein 5/6)
LYSGINLLTTYPGVLGLKTGFTPEAGLTLVTLAKRGDSEVIGVLLGSTNRREDAQKLLDYSFKKLGH